MGETAQVKVSNSKNAATAVGEQTAAKCRVRVSPGGYFGVLFLLTLAAGLLNFLGYGLSAVIILVAAWSIIPILLWFDYLEFDGKALTRVGFIAALKRVLNSPQRLRLGDIEQIETQSVWTLKSGGRAYFRYHTEISGGDLNFVFASGGKSHRRMVQRLFPLVAEEKLDALSLELRDFLVAQNDLERKTAALNLPSADVLDSTLHKLKRSGIAREAQQNFAESEESGGQNQYKVAELWRAANELRVAGNLSQAVEAFRRALLRQPENAVLLHDFARGLYTYANAAKSPAWLRRSRAALRLAAKRGGNDAVLQTRIGESFLQFGNYSRAAKAFRRALEIQTDNFRAEIGLAEIGLQDGKLAHVVHHYQAAVRAAAEPAAKRWAQTEAEYFSLLSSDQDYMDAEIARINWLNAATRARRTCWRLIFVGIPAVLLGTLVSDEFAAAGWAVTCVAAVIWAGLSLAEKILAFRSPVIENAPEE